MAVSFGTGLGVALNPEVLGQMPKPVQNIFGSAITTGGLSAIILSLVLPEESAEKAATHTKPSVGDAKLTESV
jgi:xanthine permease XanP